MRGIEGGVLGQEITIGEVAGPAVGIENGVVEWLTIELHEEFTMQDGNTIVRTITSDPFAVMDLGSAVQRNAAQHRPNSPVRKA